MTPTDGRPARRRLYIVDDHPLMRKVLSQTLNRTNDLSVIGSAPSAEAALEELSQLEPDLVLVDYSLPGMNGVELIKRLQKSHPRTPCLLISSWQERVLIDAALAAGARGYVVKSDPDILLQAINDVLEGHVVVKTDVSS